jgi:hypothetical protein
MPDPGQGGVLSVKAEDGRAVEADQATETAADVPLTAGDAAAAAKPDPGAPAAGPAAEPASAFASESVPASASRPEPESEARSGSAPEAASEPGAESESGAGDESESESDPDAASGRRLPIATGIGCAALLLPLVAVAGAILCFAAGILSAASGCAPNGSALCSASGPWLAFALPLFVSPLIAAATAIGAVTVRRHRSTWLAVGYGVVFISVIVGLASASTGSG